VPASLSRRMIAEFIGTFLLVFLAVGSAVFGIAAVVGADGNGPGSGVVGVAFGFGLMLLGLAYAIGPISGAHVNPAVTLAVLLDRRIPASEAVGYWVVQFPGGVAGTRDIPHVSIWSRVNPHVSVAANTSRECLSVRP
jgi:Glycerol uptake facilitator and related permeases (Major Intrinsic Protein Family)